MIFIKNAEAVAQLAMSEISPPLADGFVALIRFLSAYPECASSMRGKEAPEVGSEGYIRAAAKNFANGRDPKRPTPPDTIPDEMVSFVLEHYFDVPAQSLDRAKHEHALSMGAESIVGDLLERYLASVLEPHGWIWCSGSLVKAVDFVLPPTKRGLPWRLLQVKNRDNSENSSSSAIRKGTNIEKWHRTFSRKSGSNWDAFPDKTAKDTLSEKGFRTFVESYLQRLKAK
jgi:SinI restriction endonuclease